MSIKQAADVIRQQGRGNDSMLMHVTPNEVQSLQGIAQAHGGSLTVNPETGLPEAGFLEDILPTVAGIGIGFATGNPMLGAAIAGGTGFAATGSLEKGLMAGLGAFGGASALGGLAASGAAAGGAGAGIGGAAGGAGAAGGVGATGTATSIGSGAVGGGSTMIPASGMSSAAGIGGSTSYGTTVGGVALPSTTAAGIPTSAAPGVVTDAGAAQLMGTSLSPSGYSALPVGQKFSALGQGFSNMGSDFMGGIDAMGKGNLLMASAPILGAGLGQEDEMANPEVQDSYIRPQVFDPVSQTYTALDPVKSSDWGDRSFDEYRSSQGYQEGGIIQQRYAQPTRTVDPAVTERNNQIMQQAQQEYVQGVSTPTPLAPQVIAQQEAFANRPKPEIPTSQKMIYDPVNQMYSENPNYVAPIVEDKSSIRRRDRDDNSWNENYNQDGSLIGRAAGGHIKNLAGGGIASLGSTPRFQAGGEMESDAFIVPADVVSALGNGSTDAGVDVLNQYLGMAMPIEGEGDGLSDDVPASIEGEQPARVADGEVYLPASVVAQLGEGDPERGAAKLYTMLDRIRESAHGKKSQQKEVSPEKVVPNAKV